MRIPNSIFWRFKNEHNALSSGSHFRVAVVFLEAQQQQKGDPLAGGVGDLCCSGGGTPLSSSFADCMIRDWEGLGWRICSE